MTRPDPNTPRAPENAHSGPQERPEGGSGTRAAPEGANGQQTGADGFDGGQAPRGPIYWARKQQAEREARQAIRTLDDPPTHNAGPTVRECADNDRRWWADKYAGEGT